MRTGTHAPIWTHTRTQAHTDKYVDSSKEKLTKAADKLLKLYKSKEVGEEDRKKLIELEKRLRLVFKEVDQIDKTVEDMAREDRLKKD